MPQEERSGRAPFRARARLIRLLGEELISNEAMALAELVKNAYDADAHAVVVRLHNPPEQGGMTIEVMDDGDGMSLDTILHSWLEPAASQKRRRQRTALGRLPLGEKGVGRFAADKLGEEMELISRPRTGGDEVMLHVHWHHFEDDGYLDDIENTWETHEPREFLGAGHGTIVRVRRPRTTWDATLVTRVRESLSRLISPHAHARDFSIELTCPAFPELTGPITGTLPSNAPHRLAGRVDTQGLLNIDDGTDDIGAIDLRLVDPALFMKNGSLRPPVCGAFSLRLDVWDLDAIGDSSSTADRTTRAALRACSGVSIYRDGFRVMPYGERGDDWLELNQRRVNNPTMRVSNNQIVGLIEITGQYNQDLRDRTSREGLLDTQAFFDLRALVLAALSMLEQARFARRHPRAAISTAIKTADVERDGVLQLLANAHARAQDGPGPRTDLQEIERAYKQALEEQQARYDHVVRLAGVGLAAEKLTREVNKTLGAVTMTLRTLLNQARTLQQDSPLNGYLALLQEQYELLDEQLNLMAPLYRPSVRELEQLDVRAVVNDVVRMLDVELGEMQVHLDVTQDAPLTLRINRGHLMQVLLTLFDNALHALQNRGSDVDARIGVHINAGPRDAGLIVADNGPGVRPEARHLIFAPFYAARAGGRGLGLHVAQDILASYNSSIVLLEAGTLLPGANFAIKFDGRRVCLSATLPAPLIEANATTR